MSDESVQLRTTAATTAPMTRTLSGVELKKLADGRGFSVDEDTGDRMIKSLQEIVDVLEQRWAALEKLGSTPLLSDGATAQWVSQRTVETAADEQGLLTQLRQARAELPQYIEAIQTAKRNYAETESAHEERFRGLAPS